MMKRTVSLILLLAVFMLMLSSCAAGGKQETGLPQNEEIADVPETAEADDKQEEEVTQMMRLLIDGAEVPVTWLDNPSVDEIRDIVKDGDIRIEMSMYGGFEQVGSLGRSITRDDSQTKTQYGDIVLYSGDQIVVFYGSNSWAYTRLGHVDLSQQELKDLLGAHDVVLTLTWK